MNRNELSIIDLDLEDKAYTRLCICFKNMKHLFNSIDKTKYILQSVSSTWFHFLMSDSKGWFKIASIESVDGKYRLHWDSQYEVSVIDILTQTFAAVNCMIVMEHTMENNEPAV